MAVHDYKELLLSDIDWRTSQLKQIRILPIKYNFDQPDKDKHYRNSTPIIYSILEGYVKTIATEYLNYINSLNIGLNELPLEILASHFNATCKFNEPKISFDSKKEIVKKIIDLYSNFDLKTNRKINSNNINIKSLNTTLNELALPEIEIKELEYKLNKLLNFRNRIAHGENSITVSKEEFYDFINTVITTMHELYKHIELNEFKSK